MDDALLTRVCAGRNSLYIYEEAKIIEAARRLLCSFPGIEFLYSMKCNSNPAVVDCVLSQGFGVDAASIKEACTGYDAGLGVEHIQYSAPGKSEKDIREALPIATLIADSPGEIQRIEEIASDMGIVARIGIRVNPNFSFSGGQGASSKFGIDECQVFAQLPAWKDLPHVSIAGLHVHLKSQELNADILDGYYGYIFDLASRFQNALGATLQFINMGSGLGIQYAPDDDPLDVAALGKAAVGRMNEFKNSFPELKVYIETGRYVVGKAGSYATRVMDKKVSQGRTYVILHNTLNGFIRPSIAQMIAGYSCEETPVGSEPLFTAVDAFSFHAVTNSEQCETVELVGNLCTASDVIGHGVNVPKLEVGDLVVINNAGAYAEVLSPVQFSSQVPPDKVFITTCGDVQVIEE